MNIYLRVACYAILLAVWGSFVWTGKAPVDAFIGVITAALAALGAVHISDSGKS